MLRLGAALALACAMALPAAAQGLNGSNGAMKLVEYQSPLLPPSNYKGQWWTSPQNCQYSRAGRPGETVWYLIVNTARMECPKRLIQRAYSDYN